MARPKIIIVDEDISYVIPLQFKFITDFFNKIDLEIITDRDYFKEYFSHPQNANILIISEELYNPSLQRHNIQSIFVMKEQYDDETHGLNVTNLFKYASIKEIFNKVMGKSAGVFNNIVSVEKKETQIILVTSAAGGVGKTTIAMGIAACLAQNYKRVLYVNAARLQNFQYLLDNNTPIVSPNIYTKLIGLNGDIYSFIKPVIRKEMFSYVPAFKASLMSIGLDFSVYSKLVISARKSEDYDFIIIDSESTFDEEKTNLIDISDKVIIITDQSLMSVNATNIFLANISCNNSEKYIYVCNKFDKDESNALINPKLSLKFNITEYVEKITANEVRKCSDIPHINGLKKISFLII